ncbi:MAG: HAD-IB family phosphatase [bacterium]|nr:HAD-IB family phosphatase [bacterium]
MSELASVRVFIDFDGTIAKNDVSDEFFIAHNAFEPARTELAEGSISVAEYYRRACAALPAELTDADVAAFALTQEVDTGFASLVAWCDAHTIPISVVSDGFLNYILPSLKQAGVRDIPVFANVLDAQTLYPSYPNASESCTCFCASCKRNVVITNSAPDDILVYIGDGFSDTCAASHCDIVFAKTELAAFCTAERIPHHPWSRLSDVQRILEQYHRTGRFRARRQAVLARKRAIEAE